MIFLDGLYTVTKIFLILYIFVVKKHEIRIKQMQTMSRLMRGMESPFLLRRLQELFLV